jgi:hypothetical protein
MDGREAAPFLIAPALADVADQLLTEPKSAKDWAAFYGCSERKMRRWLKQELPFGRVRKFGGQWRLPLVPAPPNYLMQIGLLSPASPASKLTDKSGQNVPAAPEPNSANRGEENLLASVEVRANRDRMSANGHTG